jgi:hypothetical protein
MPKKEPLPLKQVDAILQEVATKHLDEHALEQHNIEQAAVIPPYNSPSKK